MKILIVSTFTPSRLPCRQAILAAELRAGAKLGDRQVVPPANTLAVQMSLGSDLEPMTLPRAEMGSVL
jgi:hypothetical protein